MKKLLFFVFMILTVTAFGQRTGVKDKSIHATQLLETDADTILVGDTTTYPLDVQYSEWSSDGVTFEKDYNVGDTWLRFSSFSKQSWDTIRVYVGLWTLSGDTIYASYPNVNMDTVVVTDKIDAPLYLLNGDTLSLTNIPTGIGGDGTYYLRYGGDTAYWSPLSSGFGETNLAENVGDGVGVYYDKVDSTFQFRGISSTTSALTVTLNATDTAIDLDLVLGDVIAGVGLSGTGNVEDGSVTINLYIPELTTLTSLSTPDKIDDWVIIYDLSTATHKKIHPRYFHPDVYVDDILDAQTPSYLNFMAGDAITITGDEGGGVLIGVDTASLVDMLGADSQTLSIDSTDRDFTISISNGNSVSFSVLDIDTLFTTIAISDQITALTTGTAIQTFRMPVHATLVGARASVATAPTGANLVLDINEGGTSVLSTKLSIDAGEKTSTTAATTAVISDSDIADDAEMTIDIDQVGSTVAGAGAKIIIYYVKQ